MFHRTARAVSSRYYGTLRFVTLDVVTELLPPEALADLDRLPAVLLYRGEKSSPRLYAGPWRANDDLQVCMTVVPVLRALKGDGDAPPLAEQLVRAQGFLTSNLPPPKGQLHVSKGGWEPCVAIEAKEEVSGGLRQEESWRLERIIASEVAAGADGAALNLLALEVVALLHPNLATVMKRVID